MFYFHDILKRKGKFGVIWLAATAPKRLKKRDICSVNISQATEDLLEVLTTHASVGGRRHVHFSLYLSSQLMYGLSSVSFSQHDILLEDVKNLAGQLGRYRTQVPTVIDLQEPVSGFRVTFDEPDFDNIPLDFGNLLLHYMPPEHFHSYEYFMVSTPKSSEEEWRIIPGPPDVQQPSAITDEIADQHIARVEDITLEDVIPSITEEHVLETIPGPVPEEADFLAAPLSFLAPPAPDLDLEAALRDIPQPIPETLPEMPEVQLAQPEIEADIPRELDASVVPPPPPPALQPSDIQPESEQPIDQPEVLDLYTSDIPTAPSEPIPKEPSTEVGDIPLPVPPVPDRQTRRTQFDTSDSFILGPVVTTPRRTLRRRHLIIDQETVLSRAEIEHNLATANTNLVIPLQRPSFDESVQSMFTRFGSRATEVSNKRFWPKIRTLHEPDDLSPFGAFLEEEPEAPERVPEPISPPELADVIEAIRGEGLEESQDVTSRTLGTIKTLHDTRDQSSATISSSLDVPDVITADGFGMRESSLDLMGKPVSIGESLDISRMMRPEADITHEPEILPEEFSEELEIEAEREISEPVKEVRKPTKKKEKICVVSPEKTPPPASPEEPHSPHAEHAVDFIKEAFNESSEPIITFSSVISHSPRSRSRVYVAKLFYEIICLHSSSVISIQQPVMNGEIFISKGPNFDAF